MTDSIFSRKEPKLPMPYAITYHSCSTVRVAKKDVRRNGQRNHGTKTLALLPVRIAAATVTKRDQSFVNAVKIKLPKNIATTYANLLRPSRVLSRAKLSAKRTSRFSVGSCISRNIAAPKISENFAV